MCLSYGTSSRCCSGRVTLVPQCHHAALGYRRRPVGRNSLEMDNWVLEKICFLLSSGFVWTSCNKMHWITSKVDWHFETFTSDTIWKQKQSQALILITLTCNLFCCYLNLQSDVNYRIPRASRAMKTAVLTGYIPVTLGVTVHIVLISLPPARVTLKHRWQYNGVATVNWLALFLVPGANTEGHPRTAVPLAVSHVTARARVTSTGGGVTACQPGYFAGVGPAKSNDVTVVDVRKATTWGG